MIAGIVFDKDGTLFDFRKSWGGWARRMLAEVAGPDADVRRLGQAIGFDIDSGRFAPDSPVIAATAIDIAGVLAPLLPGATVGALADRMNALAETAVMEPAVPLVPVLTDLRGRGLRLGLATNDTEAPARAHLAAQGVTHLFDFIAGYDSGHGAKPGPGQLLAFAAATGLPPSRVVMVGDSHHDLVAGRAAGMRTVAVLTGIATADELSPLADVVLADIGGLAGWIDAQSVA
ncbi:MAG: HAD family hydrolase [Paracoccaceae bacterium]|nr:MAG: HAD family hydrolase [Paracoccaceae bacterium]